MELHDSEARCGVGGVGVGVGGKMGECSRVRGEELGDIKLPSS